MANLITLSDLKTFLDITSDYDNVLNIIIPGVSLFIERYIGRTVAEATYTNEYYDGSGNKSIILNNFPVSAVSSLQERQIAENSDSWETLDSEDYYIDETTGVITKVYGIFSSGKQKYRVTYTAGETVPADLQLAAMKMARSEFYKRKTAGDVTSERLKNYQVSYGGLNGAVTAMSDVQSTLDLYKDYNI